VDRDLAFYRVVDNWQPSGIARPQEADEQASRAKRKERFPLGEFGDAVPAIYVEAVRADKDVAPADCSGQLRRG